MAELRSIAAVIDLEMVNLPAASALREAWVEFVRVLALGPGPETRECPACHGVGMRAASRCGQCWAALAPYVAPSDAPNVAGES